VTIGHRIAHYRLLDQLGAGGMGVVYRAEDVHLACQVALEFLRPDLSHDAHAGDRSAVSDLGRGRRIRTRTGARTGKDGRRFLIVQDDQANSDIVVVENFPLAPPPDAR
jgi:serine/threonine protein kinase